MRKNAHLDELIQILEKEKKILNRSIKECIREWDYLMADAHAEALKHINYKLQVLYSFRNPSLSEKASELLSRKKMIKAQIPRFKNNEQMCDYLLDKINRLDAQLKEIENKEAAQFQDTQHLDDALFDLAEGRIQSFQLIFKNEKVHIKFERNSINVLELAIGPIQMLTYAFLSRRKNRAALLNLGFELESSADKYVYHYDLTKFRDAVFIKTLLARLIYDVFNYSNFGKDREVELRSTFQD